MSIQKAEQELKEIITTIDKLQKQFTAKEKELKTLNADDYLDNNLEEYAEKKNKLVTEIKTLEELITKKRTIKTEKEKDVFRAEAEEKREQAKDFRKQAKEHEQKTRKILDELKEHEGIEFFPVQPEELKVGEFFHSPAETVKHYTKERPIRAKTAVTNTGKLLIKAEQLENEANRILAKIK